MTPQVLEFVQKLNLQGRTLDVGSMDVNGSVRDFFINYIGLDMRLGKNVDIVAKANHLPFVSNLFDNVTCLEMLEHDDCFWESIPEMIRVLKIGGSFVLTARGIHFEKHEYPHDYWRFTKESFELLCKGLANIVCIDETGESGVFLCGVKGA